MRAQQHEAILDYKYPTPLDLRVFTAYGAINIKHQVYSAYQFDASNSGNNIEYYQVRQQITVRNERIYNVPPKYDFWWFRTDDGKYNRGRGCWMAQIYTKMKLEGKGTKRIMFVSPTNKNGSTSGTTTIGGSDGISLGGAGGANFGEIPGLTGGGTFNISYSHSWTWSKSTSWSVSDIETKCTWSDDNPEVLWIHNGYEPRSEEDTNNDRMTTKPMLTSTCTTDENVIWKVENPQDTYKLKAYFHVMAAIVKMQGRKWKTHAFDYIQNPFDISFVLNTPDRYKYTWSNAIYNYGTAQGDSKLSTDLRNYIDNKYGSGAEKDVDRCWGETFTTSEATKNGSENARLLFQTFKNRVFADKQAIKAASFGGQIEFVLKPVDDADITESFILDLDNIYTKDDNVTEKVNGYDLTFKVTKTDKEVELSSVPEDFPGQLVIPESISNDQLTMTGLGKNCAAHNKGITSIVIPPTVASISSYAFYYLPNLIEVHIKATTPPAMGEQVFKGSYNKATLYVPKGCKNAYAHASEWCWFENIVEE